LDRRGIDYLMTCRRSPDWNFYQAQGWLVSKLARADVPRWLVPIGKNGDVEVYRVKR
jgi:hypothetical protein